jgi:5S rRNA maturation endonuclease (ribonuclease M5)
VDAQGIVDVCDRLGLNHGRPYNSAKRGAHISISCPLAPWKHDDDTDHNKSCSVTIDEDGPSMARCHSFNCDFRGTFFRLIQSSILKRPQPPEDLRELLLYLAEVEKDTIEAHAARMAERVDVVWDDRKVVTPRIAPKNRDRDVLDEDTLAPFRDSIPRYVVQRDISVEAAKVWELGYDKRMGRLVFPVRRFDGALVGMTGRILPTIEAQRKNAGTEVTKYHNYSGLNKTLYLYGAHLWEKNRPVVICEGPIDAIRTWMVLGDKANVGATLGQGFSENHRRIIKAAWPPGVYIFGDADSAGRRMAEKVHHQLNGAVPMFLMKCPHVEKLDEDGEPYRVALDPGAMSDEQIDHAYQVAVPILDQVEWNDG